ncbi:MAG: hypothetical protein ACHQ53_07990, partial [Polyangiales bacterium]
MSAATGRAFMVTFATTALGERLVAALAADERTRLVLGVHGSDEVSPLAPQPCVSYVAADLGQHHDVRELLLGRALEL